MVTSKCQSSFQDSFHTHTVTRNHQKTNVWSRLQFFKMPLSTIVNRDIGGEYGQKFKLIKVFIFLKQNYVEVGFTAK